ADIDYFVVIDEDNKIVMAQVDRADAMTQIHEGAIYGHQGEQFLITRMEYDDRRVYAKHINPDYFTEAEVDVDVRVIAEDDRQPSRAHVLYRGEVGVKTIATVFKKIKFYTRENVGAGEITLPPEEMDTTAAWMLLDPDAASDLGLFDPRNAAAWSGIA
ncbi:MAG: ATP-dependent helicase, partial [Planctomycetota bacterium]